MQSPAPVMMPMPHPQYLRSSISPHTLELQRAFRQLCGSGNLAAVVRLLEAAEREREPETERRRRSTEEDLDLTQGLVAAIYGKRIQMAEYLLKQGAAVDRSDVSNAAASVKSIALFELLIQHGWDINSSVMGGETILPYVRKLSYFFSYIHPFNVHLKFEIREFESIYIYIYARAYIKSLSS